MFKLIKHAVFTAIDLFGTQLIPLVHDNPKKNIEIIKLELPILQQQHKHPLRIVHISDLHIGFQYQYSDLIEHIEMINALEPHIVAITGDLFDNLRTIKQDPFKYIPLLKTIKASHGVYFCYGNHDQRIFMNNDYLDILSNSNITLLNNYGHTIEYDGELIYLCGTDDIINASGNISQALSNRPNQNMPTIALVHEGDYADFTKRFKVDLQLSGHSHGGQIRFPIFGALVKPKLGSKYVKGLHKLKYKKHRMYLHVSKGLGTTHLPIRLFCKKDIALITLNKK